MSSIFGGTSRQSLDLPAGLRDQIGQTSQALGQGAGRIGELGGQAAGQVQTGFGGFAPTLNTQFSGPQFAAGLDERAKGLVSQGQQQLAQGASAQSQALSNQFRQQPGIARALAAQSGNRAALQANPLRFQAAADQRQREGQEFQLGQQAQQFSNAALLAQGQEGSRLQQLGNQALGQQLGFSGAGQAANQGFLSSLGQLGPVLGTQVQKQGGIFSK